MPDPRADLKVIGQWVINTCLLFGCDPETAYRVAASFVAGVRRERETHHLAQEGTNP